MIPSFIGFLVCLFGLCFYLGWTVRGDYEQPIQELPDWLKPDPWWTRAVHWFTTIEFLRCPKCQDRRIAFETRHAAQCWCCYAEEMSAASWPADFGPQDHQDG